MFNFVDELHFSDIERHEYRMGSSQKESPKSGLRGMMLRTVIQVMGKKF